jgi:fluoride exporter
MRTVLLQALLVGTGGFIGSVLRHGANVLAAVLLPGARYPVATFAVNLIGCVLIGLFEGWATRGSSICAQLRLFSVVGVLGGFTTFSTFGSETFVLARSGFAGVAAANVVLQVALGLLGVWLGHTLVTLGSPR